MKRDILKEIGEKIESIRNEIDAKLKVDWDELEGELKLGSDWDDPFLLTKAMDEQPARYAQWASLYKKAKKERDRYKKVIDRYEGLMKDRLSEILYKKNQQKGMTANNSKPTAKDVDNSFIKVFSKKKKYKSMILKLEKLEDYVDTLEVIKEAFLLRKDMLISISSMVRTLLEQKIMIYQRASRHIKQKTKNGGSNEV